ncbi:MAG TPA: hypothetical protein VGN06_12920 [Gaiellaceae bacterium]
MRRRSLGMTAFIGFLDAFVLASFVVGVVRLRATRELRVVERRETALSTARRSRQATG